MMRYFVALLALTVLVSSGTAQLTREWTKRVSVPNSANNIIIKTELFKPTKEGQSEAIYSLSSVTMLDGRVVFHLVKRGSDGSVVWSRVQSLTTANQKVWAKDFSLDADGNVAVLAEIKPRADFDLMVYRFNADGVAGSKTLLRNKYADENWNMHDSDDRAIAIRLTPDTENPDSGDAFVLSREMGEIAMGPYARMARINLDGSVEWANKYQQPRSKDWSGELINDPKGFVLDSSGLSGFMLMHTLADIDESDQMDLVQFSRDGIFTLRWTISFGSSSGGQWVPASDIPIAITSDAFGIYVIGNTIRTDFTKNGEPYPVRMETLIIFSPAGEIEDGQTLLYTDSQGRPGQYNPKCVAGLGNGEFVIGGSVEPYGERPKSYVHRFNFSHQLLMKHEGPTGVIYDVNADPDGNIYATGAEYIKTGTGYENKALLLGLTPTGGVRFKTNLALNTKNPGTQGVSVHVNEARDLYVGTREYALQSDGTTAYATTTVSKFTQDPMVNLLEVTPIGVPGGEPFQIHIELNKKAGPAGFKFTLATDKPGVAVPDNLIVPAGEDEWDFTIGTVAVATTRTVNLVANPGGATASINIFSGWVKSLTLTKTELLGGESLQGTVRLNAPAPAGGAVVSLSTTSDRIKLPKDDFVFIPEGSSQRTLNIGTLAVEAVTEAFVGATYNSTARVQVFLHPAQVTSFTAPSSLAGGTFGNATVTLSGPAPEGGMPVTIKSDSDALAGMTVLVPKDASSLTFRLNTMPVSSDTVVHLSAKTTLTSMTADVTVKAAVLKAVWMDPATIVGGGTAYVVVDLTALTPSGGEPITLQSNSSSATVQANATVAAGKSRVKIPVKTSAVSGTTSAEISVTHKGITMKATLTITAG